MYKVTAGRGIADDNDVRLFTVSKENLGHREADAMTHYICALLNESNTSFTEFLIRYLQN